MGPKIFGTKIVKASNHNHNYNLMGFDTIEINLVIYQRLAHYSTERLELWHLYEHPLPISLEKPTYKFLPPNLTCLYCFLCVSVDIFNRRPKEAHIAQNLKDIRILELEKTWRSLSTLMNLEWIERNEKKIQKNWNQLDWEEKK